MVGMGQAERVVDVTKKLRRLFPQLFGNDYRTVSPRTRRYNCLAWALGDTTAWWDAGPGGVWPSGVPDDGSVNAAIRFFEHFGYAPVASADLEPGVLKIAVFGDDQGYTHAAKQLPDGRWSSKLGKLQDIEHRTLDNLCGKEYGTVVQVMAKR